MKKTLFALLTLALFSCTESKKQEGNLHLTGNIKGLQTGTLYIKKADDTTLVTIDSIKIDGDSHFEAYLDVTSPEVYYLVLDRGKTNSIDNTLPFFAEQGKMNIETDLAHYYSNAKITGSKNQELLDNYKKVNARYKDQRLGLTEERFWSERNNNKIKSDSLEKLQNGILKRKYLYAINFIVQHKDYEVAPYIALSEISDVQPKYREIIQNSLSPKVAQSYYGKKLIEYYDNLKKEENN